MFGNVCGVDAPVKSRPYQHYAFFAPDGDTSVSLCVDYCPVTKERLFLYSPSGDSGSSYVLAPPTEPVMKQCFPVATELSAAGRAQVSSLKTRLSRVHAVSDIATAWELLLLALLLACLAAFPLLRVAPAAPRKLSWTALVLLAVAAAAATLVCTWRVSEAARLHGKDFPAVASLRAAAVATLLAAFCAAQLLFCFNLLPRVLTGAEATATAASFLKTHLASVAAAAAATAVVVAATAAYWLHVALFVLTSADVVRRSLDSAKYQVDSASQVEWSAGWLPSLLLHSAAAAAAAASARALHQIAVARGVAGWFFGAPVSIRAGVADAVRFQTGTAVLHASLGLALAPVSACLAALRAAAPALRVLSHRAETRTVAVLDFLLRAARFQGPFALPVASIKGLGYRDAVDEAHRLAAKNPRLAAAAERCTWVAPWLWNAAVAACAGVGVLVAASVDPFYVYGTDWEPPLSSPLWPAVFATVVTHAAVAPVFDTLRVAVDTLATCAMMDRDECGAGRAQGSRRDIVETLNQVADALDGGSV